MSANAVLTFGEASIGNAVLYLYIHWTSPEEIGEIIKHCKEHYRDPTRDPDYAFARLVGYTCYVKGRDNDHTVGVGITRNPKFGLDTDNGLYIIGKGWSVTHKGGFYSK